MQHQQIIYATIAYVRQSLQDAEGGHDWFHIERVWKLARAIAASEPDCDGLVVELGALLHDIADAKFHNGDEELGPQRAGDFLSSLSVAADRIVQVQNIIRHISFKGGKEASAFESPELFIVRDADRLDAMGAIGIGRAFSYGGYKGRAMYDPAVPPDLAMDKEAYRKSTAPTLNHFYEKLLLLKDLMHTGKGRELAEGRHRFLELFLEEFLREWEGAG